MSKQVPNLNLVFLLFFTFFINASSTEYNVTTYGAKPNVKRHATRAFLKTWQAACNSATPATINVPEGSYVIKALKFQGPCKNEITVRIFGTLIAPKNYRRLGNVKHWILFIKVDKVSVFGGTLDANGAGFWACRKSKKRCPSGARSITFNWANKIVVDGLRSINSQVTHLVINSCNNVVVRNVNLVAPDKSPNTDGIHVQLSSDVTITKSNLQTGDDCVSIGSGTKNLYMSKINCGPGHGVSIGSLGRDKHEDGVQNVTLTDSVFTGSDNGVRIKTWARPSNGFVKNILFQNIVMNNVQNPIVIDQNYCPHNIGCPNKTSGVKISDVTYKNITGTSRTSEVMNFDCSPSSPCKGIRLENIKLLCVEKASTSSCRNVDGTSSGVVVPNSCL